MIETFEAVDVVALKNPCSHLNLCPLILFNLKYHGIVYSQKQLKDSKGRLYCTYCVQIHNVQVHLKMFAFPKRKIFQLFLTTHFLKQSSIKLLITKACLQYFFVFLTKIFRVRFTLILIINVLKLPLPMKQSSIKPHNVYYILPFLYFKLK